MAIFQNLVAGLSLDSTAFDRNARRSSQTMKSMQRQSLALQKHILGLAGAYLGVRGLTHAIRSVVTAGMEQEAAERRLQAALEASGDAIGENFKRLKNYASQIQLVTIYGDEQILNQMAYARSLGISSEALAATTKGAIGLSTALGLDLKTAVRYSALALQGEFTTLQRYVPELRMATDAGEKLAIVHRKMAEGFRQAQADTDTMAGRMSQLSNVWGDTQEALAEGFLVPLKTTFETLTIWLQQNQNDFRTWTESVIHFFDTVSDKAIEFGDVVARQLHKGDAISIAQERYRNETGDRQAFTQQFHPGGFGGGVATRRPANPQRFNEILAETRAMMERERTAPSGYKTLTELRAEAISSKFEMPDFSAVVPRQTAGVGENEAKETVQNTRDIWQATRQMYDQIDSRTEASHDARLAYLMRQRREYEDLGIAANAIDVWYTDEYRKHMEQRWRDTGTLFDGVRAGISEMKRELPTIADMGASLAATLRDGVVGNLTDAVFEARNLGEAFEQTARSMAKMAFQWGMNQLVTGGLNAAFGVQTVHGGGTIGGAVQVKRPSVTMPFVGAPRFHSGGDVPAWLQTGERVQSRAQVAAGDRANAEMVGLLKDIRRAVQAGGTTVINSLDPTDLLDKAAQTHRGQRIIMNVIGKNE